jgi:hypothetical protein
MTDAVDWHAAVCVTADVGSLSAMASTLQRLHPGVLHFSANCVKRVCATRPAIQRLVKAPAATRA